MVSSQSDRDDASLGYCKLPDKGGQATMTPWAATAARPERRTPRERTDDEAILAAHGAGGRGRAGPGAGVRGAGGRQEGRGGFRRPQVHGPGGVGGGGAGEPDALHA